MLRCRTSSLKVATRGGPVPAQSTVGASIRASWMSIQAMNVKTIIEEELGIEDVTVVEYQGG